MAEKPQQSGFAVALFALLGLISLPQVLKFQDAGPALPSKSEKSSITPLAARDPDDQENDHRGDLKPLVDYLSDGHSSPPRAADLQRYLRERLSQTQVHCLVITLPDPIASVASARFDE